MNLKFIYLLCSCSLVSYVSGQEPSAPQAKAIFYKTYTATPLKDHKKVLPVQSVPPAFYACNLAFFCRQEIKFEKATKIPLKFRLGSVQQVDFLEGKPGSRNY